jgi:hypothetical protein
MDRAGAFIVCEARRSRRVQSAMREQATTSRARQPGSDKCCLPASAVARLEIDLPRVDGVRTNDPVKEQHAITVIDLML